MKIGDKLKVTANLENAYYSENPTWKTETLTILFTVEKSGAFDYGNGTCVKLEGDDVNYNNKCFDTRYFNGTLANFVDDYLKSRYGKNLKDYATA